MAYYYTKFGSISIPMDAQETTFDRKIKEGSLLTLPSGAYYSNFKNTPLALSDVSISFIIAEQTQQLLRAQYALWEAALLENQEAWLIRQPTDLAPPQKCLAKLQAMSSSPPLHKNSTFMKVALVLTLLQDRWWSKTKAFFIQNFSFNTGSTLIFNPPRRGNVEINNATVDIRVSSGVLTKIMLQPSDLSRSFSYVQPLNAGDSLQINDSLNSVYKNETQPAYAGCVQTFGPNPSSAWAPIPMGRNLLVRLWGNNVSGKVTLDYHRAYA